jgi:hypothetical protein
MHEGCKDGALTPSIAPCSCDDDDGGALASSVVHGMRPEVGALIELV